MESSRKSTLKRKYKDLIREGKFVEADKVLTEIWEMSGISKVSNKSGKTVVKTPTKKKVDKEEDEKEDKKRWIKEELQEKDFEELRDIGYEMGVRGRSKKGIIKDILDVQSGKKKPEID